MVLLADCAMVTCTEPLTYTPPGSACGCVRPIQVKLRLGIAIYTFFPLVSELTEEIAASVGLNHSQVRIMGANAASQQLEKSTVLINLVPRGVKFKDTTAFSIYRKFWKRQMSIKASLFGPYEVLYVRYPGNIYVSPATLYFITVALIIKAAGVSFVGVIPWFYAKIRYPVWNLKLLFSTEQVFHPPHL